MTIPLNAYAARSCPTRTHFDVVAPVVPAKPDTLQRMLLDDGLAHEQAVFDVLIRAWPTATRIDASLPAERREQLSLQALQDGVPLLLGARLKDDVRVGEPDVLVRVTGTPADGRHRYAPLEIKTHDVQTTTPSGAQIVAHTLDELAWPSRDDARGYGRQSGATRRTLIQLAHYHTLLADSGFGADGEPWVGIIGPDMTAVWFCLDDPIGRHDDTLGNTHNPVSVARIYAIEFALRRAIAIDATTDPDATVRSRLAPPVSNPECPHCPWREHCGRLWAERDDVSLLPRVDRHLWMALQQAGLDTIPALAAFDTRHAVSGITASTLQGLSDQARARTGPHVAYLRRGVTRVDVPRADIEVDVDMENVEGGAYLWGMYLTDRSSTGEFNTGYVGFADWDADASVAADRSFARFWVALTAVRDRARTRGMTFAAYCWSEHAENLWLRKGARALGVTDDVEAFIESDEWVDLYDVVRRQLVTGRSNGLKTFAPLTGFQWRDANAGGEQAIVWWQHATDDATPHAEQNGWRTRLLTYNEDDVKATLHVRNWLDENAMRLPAITSWPTP
jgi:predicted RecB family nuclease